MLAQTTQNKNGVSLKFLITDYNTLDSNYQKQHDPDRFMNPDDINYAAELQYTRSFNSSLSLGLPLTIGSVDALQTIYDSSNVDCQPCQERIKDDFILGAGVNAIYKFNNGYLLKEDFVVAPYISLGFNFNYFFQRDNNIDLSIPIGIGTNVRLNQNFYLQAQFDFRKSLLIEKDHLIISFGIQWIFE